MKEQGGGRGVCCEVGEIAAGIRGGENLRLTVYVHENKGFLYTCLLTGSRLVYCH